MNVIDVPFVKRVGIQKSENGTVELPLHKSILNYLEAICGSAQYSLAETSSAELLQELFPELVGKVIPVIRETQIKNKKPALTSIKAEASPFPWCIFSMMMPPTRQLPSAPSRAHIIKPITASSIFIARGLLRFP